ncbi:MAG: hypothetical protein K6G10_01425 [Butyrivibrio sp.]|nr:hypothetical protein [Butyrivibrio sp.]
MASAAQKAEALYNYELASARGVFNTQALKDFLYQHAYDEVGVDRAGNFTTLACEVAEVARLAHKAYIADGVNYYHACEAHHMAEGNNSKRMYERAAKKLLFLNSVAKKLTGSFFITKKIDKSDLDDCVELVDCFEFCVRNYAEI